MCTPSTQTLRQHRVWRFTCIVIVLLFCALFMPLPNLRAQTPPEAPYLVKDINPGPMGSFPKYLTAVNDILFFTVYNGVTDNELWRSNGTMTGTLLIKNFKLGIAPWPGVTPIGFYMNFSDTLVFTADDGITGHEVWRSDGTITGTTLLKDINPGTKAVPSKRIPYVAGRGEIVTNHFSRPFKRWKRCSSWVMAL